MQVCDVNAFDPPRRRVQAQDRAELRDALLGVNVQDAGFEAVVEAAAPAEALQRLERIA